MARFIGAVEGSRGEVTRLGTPSSGIRAQCQGWNVGVKVYGRAEGEDDVFTIYATRGSHDSSAMREVGTVRLLGDVPVFYAYPQSEWELMNAAEAIFRARGDSDAADALYALGVSLGGDRIPGNDVSVPVTVITDEGVATGTLHGDDSISVDPAERLEYLRSALRAETISYGELAELQSLAPYIDPGDCELLEAAGVPEFPRSFRDEIRETVTPWKFGGSRRAAMLWLLSLDSGQDEETGNVDWDVWCARFGKRLLFTDDRGFVWAERYATETEASLAFDEISDRYGMWLDSDEVDA